MMKSLLIALTMVLATASPADAATRYAEASGGIATGGCTDIGNPCTLDYMVSQLGSCDTGTLLPGAYTGGTLTISGISGTSTCPITLRAQTPAVNCPDPVNDPDGCTIDTSARSVLNRQLTLTGTSTDWWIIEGLEIDRRKIETVGSGLDNGPNNIILRYLHIHHDTTEIDAAIRLVRSSDITIEHSYLFDSSLGAEASGEGPDYGIQCNIAVRRLVINNVYFAGHFGHNISIKRDCDDVTVIRTVHEGAASEAIWVGQNADDTQSTSGSSCPGTTVITGGTATVWDSTSDNVIIRQAFIRPATLGATSYTIERFGLRMNNARNADIQNVFMAGGGDDWLFMVEPDGGLGVNLSAGRCGNEPGNNRIRGMIVVNPAVNECGMIRSTGHNPSTLTIENFICNGTTSDPAFEWQTGVSNAAWETNLAPVTTMRNGSMSSCSSAFAGTSNALSFTQSHNNVFSCGTSPGGTGAQTVSPQFPGPTTVATASLNFSHGQALWDWEGRYDPIIAQFSPQGQASFEDAGTGTDSPCTGVSCDIGTNEFFGALPPGVWASCARYENLGPYATPNGLTFNDSPDEITRNDGGSWLADGFSATDPITYRIEVHGAENATNDGVYEITGATAATLTVTAVGGGDAGLADASDDNSAKVGMRALLTSSAPPWVSGKGGLAIDIDCVTKTVTMGVDAVAGSRACPLSDTPGTDCDTTVYFDKDAYLETSTGQTAITMSAGSGTDADTSGTCWRTRATYTFTQSISDLVGIWGSMQVDGDGGTHDCTASQPSPYWAWQAHE